MDTAADMKLIMNPDLQRHYGTTSKIKQVTNVSAPLHFEFIRDGNGRGLVRTKDTCDQLEWSEPFYPLKCADNRIQAPDHPMKLKLTDIPGMAIRVRETEAELFEKIQKNLEEGAWRLTAAEHTANMTLLSQLRNATASETLLWDDDGVFASETGVVLDDDDRDELLETHKPMCLRQQPQLYESYDAYKRGKEKAAREVSIGRFVGFRVMYDAKTAANDQQPFWIGKVISVNDEENTIKVHYYHTSCKRNGQWSRAAYRPWTGRDKHMSIPFDTIIDVFDHLNPNAGTLPAASRKFMLEAVTRGVLPRGIDSDSGNPQLNAGSFSRSPGARKRKKKKKKTKGKGKGRGNGKEKGHGKGKGKGKGKGTRGKSGKEPKRKRKKVTGDKGDTRSSERSKRARGSTIGAARRPSSSSSSSSTRMATRTSSSSSSSSSRAI